MERDENSDRDESLLDELRRVVQQVDPVPESLVATARASLSWRTFDDDLAELLHDSSAEPAMAGMRRRGAWPGAEPRRRAARARGRGVRHRTERTLTGQISPAGAGEVDVRHGAGVLDRGVDDGVASAPPGSRRARSASAAGPATPASGAGRPRGCRSDPGRGADPPPAERRTGSSRRPRSAPARSPPAALDRAHGHGDHAGASAAHRVARHGGARARRRAHRRRHLRARGAHGAAAAVRAARVAEARMSLALALVVGRDRPAGAPPGRPAVGVRGVADTGALHLQRALILERLGRLDEALDGYRSALTSFRRTRDRNGEARAALQPRRPADLPRRARRGRARPAPGRAPVHGARA